ncbi:MAG TPA: preprotein translocase subunit SecE [Candidatus Saccharimonadales bacterium]|nr:preprotein translocase subunit SecE [Candidatus Saccharimonadales bacterium]
MAQNNSSGRRPRIRKSAPTVRERMDAAREAAEAKSAPKQQSRIRATAAKPFKKLKFRNSRFNRVLVAIFRPVAKVLSWLVPRYFVNSWRELRQVQWPNRLDTWRLTLAVLVFATVFGALVAGVDKGLDELFKKVILK